MIWVCGLSHHRDTENTENVDFFYLPGRYRQIKTITACGPEFLPHRLNVMDITDPTGDVIAAAIEVHKTLGPGLLESTYEKCLCRELELRKSFFERQKDLPVEYKGVKLDCGYRLDILVENRLIAELKARERLQPIHEAQLLTYLKLTRIRVGLLINLNVPVLKEGIRRLVNYGGFVFFYLDKFRCSRMSSSVQSGDTDWIRKTVNSLYSVPRTSTASGRLANR